MSAAERVSLEPTDEELAARVASGDRDAFDTLYERYIGRVFRFVEKRLHNRADTEETTQEVFAQVFTSIASFRGEGAFAAWVLGIARFTIANRFRKKRHPTVPYAADSDGEVEGEALSDSAPRSPSPDEIFELYERIERLVSAAERDLSREQCRLFELHHLEHRPIADIAAELGKSEDAVKSNLYRARKLLLAR